jgi:hypothetical protein
MATDPHIEILSLHESVCIWASSSSSSSSQRSLKAKHD